MTLHHELRGTGKPLLLVHGLGGSVRSWDTVAQPLARSRKLMLIDLPGHGGSPALPGAQTIAAFADAIQNFLEQQGLRGIDLVGSSVGGRLVLELSRRGIGGHCVALDPGGFWRGWEARFLGLTLGASVRLVRLLQPVMPALTRHTLTRALLLAQLSVRPGALDAGVVLTEMRSFAATPVFDAVLAELVKGPLQQGSTRVPGRITIGWGRNDRLLLARQAARALDAFPSATLHWFENCGHFPQWDQPDETVRVVLEAVA